MTPEDRANRIASAVYPPLVPSLVRLIADAIRNAENEALDSATRKLAEHDEFLKREGFDEQSHWMEDAQGLITALQYERGNPVEAE